MRAKKRKKYSPVTKLMGLWKHNLPSVWFAGGHCLDKAEYGGLYSRTAQARDMEIDWLLRTPLRWQVMVLAFNDNGEKRWADHKVHPLNEPMTAEQMKGIMEPLIEANAKTCNKKFLISPGYFAVPSDLVDLEATKDTILEYFRDKGAFDLEHCKMIWYLRGNNEEERNGRVT